jgi:hypothetical protein
MDEAIKATDGGATKQPAAPKQPSQPARKAA